MRKYTRKLISSDVYGLMIWGPMWLHGCMLDKPMLATWLNICKNEEKWNVCEVLMRTVGAGCWVRVTPWSSRQGQIRTRCQPGNPCHSYAHYGTKYKYKYKYKFKYKYKYKYNNDTSNNDDNNDERRWWRLCSLQPSLRSPTDATHSTVCTNMHNIVGTRFTP